MGITAVGLQVLLGLLAVVALVASVWAWPLLGGRTWRSVLGRVGVLAGNQVLTLAALGLVANAYFGFYGSWGDLLGTDDAAAPPIVTGGGQPAASGRPGYGVTEVGQVALPPGTAGRLEQVVISGGETGISSPGYVYLPREYFEKKYAERRFPVILALTGYPGDARNLITRLNLPATASRAVTAKRMPPTIMVLMRPTVVPPRDTECVDVPGGPQVETYFTRDLRAAVAASYRTGLDAQSWGVFGGSTGGYCALKMSMRHPEAFSAAVSLSGYFRTAIDMTTGDLFGGSARLRDENDLMWRLRNLPIPPVSVLVTSSEKGESDYADTRAFLALARDPMRAASLILPSGGHNFNTWNREIPQVLPWLGNQLHTPARSTETAAGGHAVRQGRK
ncbi:alpha/beta hydrolase [Streptosporangium saharense]|uniref:S-formylglutathione hydrolase FrmB n=1 Tax=Streptosporangium saharense TaxID=1706840 RepID=A0A7W7VP10_9ACTN|nr:alpha/beta hydrolase-fold protein [Streptosporangium saharense]MBB4916800.1 S-formylglutathione hydrolase FrmB [Streptosporangium saharense]